MKKILLSSFLLTFLIPSSLSAQNKTDDFLKNILYEKGSAQLKNVLQQPGTFRYQLIYTKIDRDKNNNPHFTNYYYNVDSKEYFNPASTVKMPLAFLTLEKINSLKKYGVDKFITMLTDSTWSGQSTVASDTSALNGMPSVAQYIKKIFLVSDNDAYTRLYELLGQQHINERLHQMGYNDVRITRRFVPMNAEENRHTNQIRFINNKELLYKQPPAYNTDTFNFSKNILMGKAHWIANDSLVNTPMDFTTHNNISLEDLREILQSVLFPASVPPKQRFNLNDEDYKFLYQYMSELPYESDHPKYDTTEFFSSYTKFFMFKSGHTPIPSYIRIFNKPGWSYGFLTDVAYIVDFKNNVEFMLSGVIYVNSDGVLNDNKYEYDEIGYPFFKEVGDIIYQYELQRKRKHAPDFSKFKLQYEN